MSLTIDSIDTPPPFTRHHIGNFTLPTKIFEDESNLPAIQEMMKGLLIIRCELVFASAKTFGQEFHYTALGAQFREICEGEDIPIYECTVTTNDGKPVSAKWTDVGAVVERLRGKSADMFPVITRDKVSSAQSFMQDALGSGVTMAGVHVGPSLNNGNSK